MRTNLRPHVYNTHETGWRYKTAQWSWHPTIADRYLGTLAKGYWCLGPHRKLYTYFHVEFAIGGEDNMIQLALTLPYLGHLAIGFRVPRKLTEWLLYQRKEWGIRIGYIGRWVELIFASEEHMRDCGMVSYYREKRKRGEELQWSRLQTWGGVHLTFRPQLTDKLLGRPEHSLEEGEPVQTAVAMPEGNYPCTVTPETRTWQRKRWPFSRKVRKGANVELVVPIPVPGKGENSWDCEDDAIYSSTGPYRSVAEAIGEVATSALKSRASYASLDWTPDKGWPDGIGVR